MNKLRQLALLSLVVAANASATSLAERASDKAISFLAEKIGGVKTQIKGGTLSFAASSASKHIKSTNAQQEADYYAYNAPDGGYVLMAADGADFQVMGYSTEAQFSFDNIPEALQEWMADYKEALASAGSGNTYPSPTVEPVAPMITTKWGQGEPYNLKCPKYNGNPMLTGCTATAMAQILNYYKSQSYGLGTIEYVNEGVGNKELSVDYTKINYDWANMLDTYEEGSYTDAQANAVAQLMYEAGVSCKARYDVKWSGSMATSAAIPYVGFNYCYDYNCEIYDREYTLTAVWMKVIQDELTAGRPILYSGSSPSTGHAFVVDGIDEENNVHINWGWSGSCDGYYDVTFCRVAGDNYGYYNKQQMLVGISPRTAGEAYSPKLTQIGFNHYDTYSSKAYGYGIVSNYYESATKYAFTMGLAKEGVVKYTMRDSDPGSANAYYPYTNTAYERSLWYDVADTEWQESVDLPDGTYELVTLYRESGTENEWAIMPVRDGMQTTMTVADGVETMTTPINDEYATQTGKILSLEPATELIGKAPLYLTITKQDESHRQPGIRSIVRLRFTDTETGAVYDESGSDCEFDAQYSDLVERKTFCVSPTNDKGFMLPGGTYKVQVSADNGYSYMYNEEFQIEVQPAVDYPILDNSKDLYADNGTTYYWGSKIWIRNDAANKSVNKVDGTVNMSVYAKSIETGEEVRLCTFADVPVPSTQKNTFYLPNSLYPLEGAYELSMRYTTPNGERGLLNPNAEKQVITILPSESVPIPKIEATEKALPDTEYLPSGEQQTINVPMANNATSDFNGTVVASFYCEETGKYIEVEIPGIEIKSGSVATVTVPVTFPENGVYTMQMNATPASASSNVMATAYVTAPNGAPVGYRIGVGEASVKSVSVAVPKLYPNPVADSFCVKGISEPTVVRVYSAAGVLLLDTEVDANQSIGVQSLTSGIYFVQIGNSVEKMVKR